MSINYQISGAKPEKIQTDVLVFFVGSDKKLPAGLPAAVSRFLQGKIKELKFTGVSGTAELFLSAATAKAPFYCLLGAGDASLPEARRLEGVRRAIGRVMGDARRHSFRQLAVVLPVEESSLYAEAIVEATQLANYRFVVYGKRLSKEQATRSLKDVLLIVPRSAQDEVRVAVATTKRIMGGVELARHLVNQPASHMSPQRLAEEAQRIAQGSDRITVHIMDRDEAAKEGWRGFLAVAQGSVEEPKVIHLTYTPKVPARRKIVLVGKGITFDSGGLSLKPAQYMEDMKIDMTGAATVLGVFSLLEKLQLPVEIHGVIAACENMPSGNAYRPGDVLIAKNGKTIEVLNTDAEGRITLADALSFAVEMKPDAVVDLATLTGACAIAVGETYAGLWSNDEALKDSVMAAAAEAGEGMVAFPLPEEYKQFIQSKVADLRNIGTTRYGDAILAALFLQEFVGKTPWVHLDIAGPAHTNGSALPYWSYGATGYGVRTLLRFLESQSKAS